MTRRASVAEALAWIATLGPWLARSATEVLDVEPIDSLIEKRGYESAIESVLGGAQRCQILEIQWRGLFRWLNIYLLACRTPSEEECMQLSREWAVMEIEKQLCEILETSEALVRILHDVESSKAFSLPESFQMVCRDLYSRRPVAMSTLCKILSAMEAEGSQQLEDLLREGDCCTLVEMQQSCTRLVHLRERIVALAEARAC